MIEVIEEANYEGGDLSGATPSGKVGAFTSDHDGRISSVRGARKMGRRRKSSQGRGGGDRESKDAPGKHASGPLRSFTLGGHPDPGNDIARAIYATRT